MQRKRSAKVRPVRWASRVDFDMRRDSAFSYACRRPRFACNSSPEMPSKIRRFWCLGRHFRQVFQRLREGANSVGWRADSIGLRKNPEPRWLEADSHKVHYAKIRIVRPRPGRGRAHRPQQLQICLRTLILG
jgi:hypothetical protein